MRTDPITGARSHSCFVIAVASLCAAIAMVLTAIGASVMPAQAAEVAYRVEGRDARLVLRWKAPVKYSFKQVRDLRLFRFSKPVNGSIKPFAASIRDWVKSVKLLGKGRVLMIRTGANDVSIKHRRAGAAVIIEIRNRTAPAKTPPQNGGAAATTGPPQVPLLTEDLPAGGFKMVFRWSVPFDYKVAARQNQATVVFQRPARILISPEMERRLRGRGVRLVQRALGGTTVVKLSFAGNVSIRSFREGPTLRLDVRNVGRVAPQGPEARPGTGQIVPRLTVTKVDGGTRLAFDWPVSVSAAAFRYGGHLWIVFGAAARFDLAPARQRLGPNIEDIEQTLLDNATIVRLRTAERVSATLEREGWEWRVTLRRGRLLPRTPIFVKVDPKQGRGGTVAMRAGAAGSVITITDPAVGSTLFILPLRAPGLGVERERRFPTFRLLPSVQGIVVEPMADGLTVAVRGDTVEITNPHGLFVSGGR